MCIRNPLIASMKLDEQCFFSGLLLVSMWFSSLVSVREGKGSSGSSIILLLYVIIRLR